MSRKTVRLFLSIAILVAGSALMAQLAKTLPSPQPQNQVVPIRGNQIPALISGSRSGDYYLLRHDQTIERHVPGEGTQSSVSLIDSKSPLPPLSPRSMAENAAGDLLVVGITDPPVGRPEAVLYQVRLTDSVQRVQLVKNWKYDFKPLGIRVSDAGNTYLLGYPVSVTEELLHDDDFGQDGAARKISLPLVHRLDETGEIVETLRTRTLTLHSRQDLRELIHGLSATKLVVAPDEAIYTFQPASLVLHQETPERRKVSLSYSGPEGSWLTDVNFLSSEQVIYSVAQFAGKRGAGYQIRTQNLATGESVVLEEASTGLFRAISSIAGYVTLVPMAGTGRGLATSARLAQVPLLAPARPR